MPPGKVLICFGKQRKKCRTVLYRCSNFHNHLTAGAADVAHVQGFAKFFQISDIVFSDVIFDGTASHMAAHAYFVFS